VHRLRRSAAATAVVVTLVVAGTVLGTLVRSSGEQDAAPSTTTSTTTTVPIAASAPITEPEPVDPEVSWVAEALVDPIAVFAAPGDAEAERTLTAEAAVTVPDQTPVVFLVKDQLGPEGWLEVWLPVRPNGSSGWVRTADVSITEHRYRIEVSLSDRELRVFDDGAVVLEHAVGVGRRDRPTPGGVYYIKELLQPPEPDGVYGTYAYGLSGFSNVLETFAGGEAVIGIHGTNDPGSIGQEVSSGCIRLPNEVIEELVTYLPLGTPVEILA
jgi:lipoprotein-anchoring transpeptidase ErfK/SrfK